MADLRIRELSEQTTPVLTDEFAIDGTAYANAEKVTLDNLKDLIKTEISDDLNLIENYQISQNLDFNYNKMIEVANGTSDYDGVNLLQVTNMVAAAGGGSNLIEDYTMLQNLNANNFKLTGLAYGTNSNDSVSYGQVATLISARNLIENYQMTEDLDGGGNTVQDIAAGTAPGDAVNLGQINALNLIENHTLTTDLNASNFKLRNLIAGSVGTDSVNKAQMDSAIAGMIVSGVTGLTLIENYELTQNLNCGSWTLNYVATGLADSDAVNVGQMNLAIAAGGFTGYTNLIEDYVMRENLDAASNIINNLGTGVLDTDSVNKAQMEAAISSSEGSDLIEDYYMTDALDANAHQINNLQAGSLSGDAINLGQYNTAISNLNLIENYRLSSYLDANSQKITGLKSGETAYEAVNYGQMNAAIAAGAGTNLIQDYLLEYNLDCNSHKLTNLVYGTVNTDSVSLGQVNSINTALNLIENYTLTTTDLDANSFKIRNLHSGVTDTDSVNLGQVNDIVEYVVSVSGGSNLIEDYKLLTDLDANNFKLRNLIYGVIDTDSVNLGQMNNAIAASAGSTSTFYKYSKIDYPVEVVTSGGTVTWQEILTLTPSAITSGVYEYSFNIKYKIPHGQTGYLRILNKTFELEPSIRTDMSVFNYTYVENLGEQDHTEFNIRATKNYTSPTDDYVFEIEECSITFEKKQDAEVITNFTRTNADTYVELGYTLPASAATTFSWDYSNITPANVTSNITIKNESHDLLTGLAYDDSPVSVATAALQYNVPKDYYWTIEGTDTDDIRYSDTCYLKWRYYFFYGSNSILELTSTTTAEMWVELNSRSFSNDINLNYNFGIDVTKYDYYAVPETYTLSTVIDPDTLLDKDMAGIIEGYDDGNDNGIYYKLHTVTTAYGTSVTYKIFRSERKNPTSSKYVFQ